MRVYSLGVWALLFVANRHDSRLCKTHDTEMAAMGLDVAGLLPRIADIVELLITPETSRPLHSKPIIVQTVRPGPSLSKALTIHAKLLTRSAGQGTESRFY